MIGHLSRGGGGRKDLIRKILTHELPGDKSLLNSVARMGSGILQVRFFRLCPRDTDDLIVAAGSLPE